MTHLNLYRLPMSRLVVWFSESAMEVLKDANSLLEAPEVTAK